MTDHDNKTRMIFMGEAALTDGFRLIGFETLVSPDANAINELLSELLNKREHAFIVIDPSVEATGAKMLDQVRSEGGRIVLSEVPSLTNPELFPSPLDEQLSKLVGGNNDTGATP